MSNIDKQALREAAERATPGDWKYSTFDCAITDDTSSLAIVRMDSGHLNDEQSALNGAFIAAANPATVLALLDELEAKGKAWSAQDHHINQQADRIESLEKKNGELGKALGAAYKRIAEQAGIIAKQEKWIKDVEATMIAATDRAEAAEKRIADGENRIRKQNRHVCELFDDNTALRQRIIELEEKLQTADKLQDSAFRHGLQHGFSLGQTDNQAGFEECLSAYGTRGKDNG